MVDAVPSVLAVIERVLHSKFNDDEKILAINLLSWSGYDDEESIEEVLKILECRSRKRFARLNGLFWRKVGLLANTIEFKKRHG